MNHLATHKNIVILEEVTSTFGESQSFSVNEAASGIEHAQPGGNIEGWTLGLLKASRAVTQLRPKMFPDTTTIKFHRGQRLTGPGSALSWISGELSSQRGVRS